LSEPVDRGWTNRKQAQKKGKIQIFHRWEKWRRGLT
jgi:hypothetical protein